MSCSDSIPETRTLKRGATLRWDATVTDDADVPLDITAITIQSQIRREDGAVVASATINKANQVTNVGEYAGVFPSTAAWPLQKLIWDVLVLDGADTLITKTVYVRVVRAGTEFAP